MCIDATSYPPNDFLSFGVAAVIGIAALIIIMALLRSERRRGP